MNSENMPLVVENTCAGVLEEKEQPLSVTSRYKVLQERFQVQYQSLFPGKSAAKTVIVLPSLTLDKEILQKIRGGNYYEERMLCHLMLLRMPHTHLIYLTSMPIDPVIIDYYLHLLPGITGYHARQRLTLISCFDASKKSLTEKILDRPRVIDRIRKSIPVGHPAHISCFNVTDAERRLAVKLDTPIYGCDPDLEYLGNKSNSRKIFRQSGVPVPDGYEDLESEEDIIRALVGLKYSNPHLRKAVIKINDGFSGEGNAVFSYCGAPTLEKLETWVRASLPHQLAIVAEKVSYHDFIQKFVKLGGITEEFLEGDIKATPSVQCRINPLGEVEVISTHDQITGGESGQVFLGATFPAANDYARVIGEMGKTISHHLRLLGVLGRFSIDFISIRKKEEWVHYAIEINLRKGGTTHPYLMLQFLTDGKYDEEAGIYLTANGQPRFYVCSDNLQSDQYIGLTPHDLIDIAICHELLYNGTSQEGVMFHLISSLSQFGKLGVVCIGSSPDRAAYFYNKTIAVLDMEVDNKPSTP
jgi:hypothetical protein